MSRCIPARLCTRLRRSGERFAGQTRLTETRDGPAYPTGGVMSDTAKIQRKVRVPVDNASGVMRTHFRREANAGWSPCRCSDSNAKAANPRDEQRSIASSAHRRHAGRGSAAGHRVLRELSARPIRRPVVSRSHSSCRRVGAASSRAPNDLPRLPRVDVPGVLYGLALLSV